MAKEKLRVGEISKPRFEFRSFGQNFEEAAKIMAKMSAPVPEKVMERHSDEIYIVSRTNDINNTKLVTNHNNYSIMIPFNIKNRSVIGKNADTAIYRLYLCWR